MHDFVSGIGNDNVINEVNTDKGTLKNYKGFSISKKKKK